MAVINIGSGSVKLYLQSTKETKATVTLLALGGGKKEEATAQTFNAVAAFCLEAATKGEKINIFGTEAMRQNGELATLILDRLGIPVDIIDGNQEALCGFTGCGGNEYKTVIDIGGASTEISYGKLKPDYSVSLKTGSVALYNIFGKDENQGGTSDCFYNRLFDFIDNLLDFPTAACNGKIYLIGGTALYLAGVIKNQTIKTSETYFKKPSDFSPQALAGTKLKTNNIWAALKHLFSMDFKQRALQYPFLEEKRSLVLPYGVSILYKILTKLSAEEAYISTSGLIEGYIKLKNL